MTFTEQPLFPLPLYWVSSAPYLASLFVFSQTLSSPTASAPSSYHLITELPIFFFHMLKLNCVHSYWQRKSLSNCFPNLMVIQVQPETLHDAPDIPQSHVTGSWTECRMKVHLYYFHLAHLVSKRRTMYLAYAYRLDLVKNVYDPLALLVQ